jgi:hypothetical protein
MRAQAYRVAHALLAFASIFCGAAIADAQPPPPPTFIGLPEHEATGTGLNFFIDEHAKDVGDTTKEANDAVRACNRKAFEKAKGYLKHAAGLLRKRMSQLTEGSAAARMLGHDAEQYERAAQQLGEFDARCPEAKIIESVVEFILKGGLQLPFLIAGNLNASEAAGSQNDLASSSRAVPQLGGAVRVNLVKINPTLYVETGFQTGFGTPSYYQTFQRAGASQAFGENLVRENWGIPILVGATVPLGSVGRMRVDADFYGGITIANWTHSLRGGEAGVAGGGPGYGTDQTRTTIDPNFGVGLRLPAVDLDGDGRADVTLGLYGELAFRRADTVTVSSTASPGLTYNGTVDAHANASVMLRIGIPFGRGPLFRAD